MEVLVRFLITRIGKSAATFRLADITGAVSRVTPAAVTEATQALLSLLSEVGPEFAGSLTDRLTRGISRRGKD